MWMSEHFLMAASLSLEALGRLEEIPESGRGERQEPARSGASQCQL